MSKWHIYKGDGVKRALTPKEFEKAPAPPWRKFKGEIPGGEYRPPMDDRTEIRGSRFEADPEIIQMVNTAIHLRRPLLVTGDPGVGKSSLGRAVAWELGLGGALYWPVTTRTTLQDGLYHYDAFGRLQELQIAERLDRKKSDGGDGIPTESKESCQPDPDRPEAIGRYIRLGPLGTALLPSTLPKVLLIDEIDKSDIDLPNDLLNVFEEGEFDIPELRRIEEVCPEVPVLPHGKKEFVKIRGGVVRCGEFPIVIMTSNRERELPAPFLRRCLRLDIKKPDEGKLARIVLRHFGEADPKTGEIRLALIREFLDLAANSEMATDQLLNAVHLVAPGGNADKGIYDDWDKKPEEVPTEDRGNQGKGKSLKDHVFRALNQG